MSQLPDRAVQHRNRYYLCFIRKHLHSADRKSSGVFFQGYLSSPRGGEGGRGRTLFLIDITAPIQWPDPRAMSNADKNATKYSASPLPSHSSSRATPWQSIRNNVQLRSSARPHQLSPAPFCPPSN